MDQKLFIAAILLLLVFTGKSFGLDVSTSPMEYDISNAGFDVKESPGFSVPGKVAIVDKSGLHYPDPVAAMDDLATWCGAPSETNPCLIRIMPGIYDLGTKSLDMKSYVDVEGSGENATKIKSRGAIGVIRAAGHSEMRFLTIEHTGGAGLSVGVYGDVDAPSQKLSNMTILSRKGTGTNYGIYYEMDLLDPPPTPPLVVKNVTVIASGGKESVGIKNEYRGGRININRSSIKGDTNSIRNFERVSVTNTVLNGPVGGDGITTCKRVYDKDYNFYANTCP